MTRGRRVLAVAVLLASLAGATHAAPQPVGGLDLDNHPIDPFAVRPAPRATVLVFASVDCPVSNRYAPEIRRMHDAFASKGVAFWLVYPNPRETADEVRKHVADFGYPVRAIRDPKHALSTYAKAVVTPEAAVFDARGTLVYHGRIDDRYISLTVERPSAARRDLYEALTALMAGRPVTPASQPAVGCFIADFVP